ncbi:unnamed protein product [Paramecium pentaurelia]|uniref:Anaphase-promoting complex subunit 4-like WD40 domain-containing protein n=1 Tax=Paramecium pentaurelia TaxID=43138 RepID=A0A8S1V8E0_9CILI|nr:unnamed protein product [Paramecium pentaurelia]
MDNKYKQQEIHSFLDQHKKKGGKKNDQYCYGQLKFGDVQNKIRKISLKTFFGNPEFEIFCIRFDFEDQLIAAGCSDGTVKIFNIATGKLAFNLQGSSEGSTPTTSIRWRNDCANKVKSVVINVNSDGSIMFWQAQTGKQLHRLIEKNNQILCMDLRQDGEVFATSGKDCKIRIYDDEKKEIIHTFDSADYNQIGHLNRVFALKFLEEFPTTLLSCGWDGNLVIWDLRDKRSVGSIQGPHVSGDSIDFRNGQILTGSYRTNNQLQLWDFGKRSLIKNIQWDDKDSDNSYIYSCQFSKINGDTILAGSCGKQEEYIVLIMGINQTNLHLEVEKEWSTFVN